MLECQGPSGTAQGLPKGETEAETDEPPVIVRKFVGKKGIGHCVVLCSVLVFLQNVGMKGRRKAKGFFYIFLILKNKKQTRGFDCVN